MSEDEVFQAVQDLVAVGEYLDRIPGVPMPSAERGGMFAITPDGQYRRFYERGSAEYLQARASGLVEPLPADLVPASEETVQAVEDDIGLPLPPLMRRLYTEIGDGGFGPGYGLLKLSTSLSKHRQQRNDDSPAWSSFPPWLLAICGWGCAIYSYVDCSAPEGPMWGWDPNPGPIGAGALYPQSLNLAGWLGRWIDHTLYQPWLLQDPDTGEWRGATDDDYAEAFAETD